CPYLPVLTLGSVCLHDYPYGMGVDHHAADDLPRTGPYLNLGAGRATLQGLAFAGCDKASAARLGAYHLSSLYRVGIAQGAGLDRASGADTLAGDIAHCLAGIKNDIA